MQRRNRNFSLYKTAALALVLVPALVAACATAPEELAEEVETDQRGYALVDPVRTWGEDRVKEPAGVAVGSRGQVYISDAAAHAVWHFEPDGEAGARWGEEGEGPGQFKRPGDLALDEEGNLYVADVGNNRVQVLDPEGDFLYQVGGEEEFETFFQTEDDYREPLTGVAPDGEGHVWVTLSGAGYDTTDNALRRYSPEGKAVEDIRSTLLGDWDLVPFTRPMDVALGPDGDLYFTQGSNALGKVVRVPWGGELPEPGAVEDFGPLGKETGEFMHHPRGLTVDRFGNLVVADTYNHRVQVLDPEGEWLGAFDLQHREEDPLRQPVAVDLDDKGHLYVVDRGNERVVEVENPLPELYQPQEAHPEGARKSGEDSPEAREPESAPGEAGEGAG